MTATSKRVYGYLKVIKKDGDDGSCYPLMYPSIVGSGGNCDIRIHAPGVEDEHCSISPTELGRVKVKNLSKTGTVKVNGSDIKNRLVPLAHRDVISVAHRSFRFEYSPGSPYYFDRSVSDVKHLLVNSGMNNSRKSNQSQLLTGVKTAAGATTDSVSHWNFTTYSSPASRQVAVVTPVMRTQQENGDDSSVACSETKNMNSDAVGHLLSASDINLDSNQQLNQVVHVLATPRRQRSLAVKHNEKRSLTASRRAGSTEVMELPTSVSARKKKSVGLVFKVEKKTPLKTPRSRSAKKLGATPKLSVGKSHEKQGWKSSTSHCAEITGSTILSTKRIKSMGVVCKTHSRTPQPAAVRKLSLPASTSVSNANVSMLSTSERKQKKKSLGLVSKVRGTPLKIRSSCNVPNKGSSTKAKHMFSTSVHVSRRSSPKLNGTTEVELIHLNNSDSVPHHDLETPSKKRRDRMSKKCAASSQNNGASSSKSETPMTKSLARTPEKTAVGRSPRTLSVNKSYKSQKEISPIENRKRKLDIEEVRSERAAKRLKLQGTPKSPDKNKSAALRLMCHKKLSLTGTDSSKTEKLASGKKNLTVMSFPSTGKTIKKSLLPVKITKKFSGSKSLTASGFNKSSVVSDHRVKLYYSSSKNKSVKVNGSANNSINKTVSKNLEAGMMESASQQSISESKIYNKSPGSCNRSNYLHGAELPIDNSFEFEPQAIQNVGRRSRKNTSSFGQGTSTPIPEVHLKERLSQVADLSGDSVLLQDENDITVSRLEPEYKPVSKSLRNMSLSSSRSVLVSSVGSSVQKQKQFLDNSVTNINNTIRDVPSTPLSGRKSLKSRVGNKSFSLLSESDILVLSPVDEQVHSTVDSLLADSHMASMCSANFEETSDNQSYKRSKSLPRSCILETGGKSLRSGSKNFSSRSLQSDIEFSRTYHETSVENHTCYSVINCDDVEVVDETPLSKSSKRQSRKSRKALYDVSSVENQTPGVVKGSEIKSPQSSRRVSRRSVSSLCNIVHRSNTNLLAENQEIVKNYFLSDIMNNSEVRGAEEGSQNSATSSPKNLNSPLAKNSCPDEINTLEVQNIDDAKTEYGKRRSRKSSASLQGSSGSQRVPERNNSFGENSDKLEHVNQRSILNTSEVQLIGDAKTEYATRRSRKSSVLLQGSSESLGVSERNNLLGEGSILSSSEVQLNKTEYGKRRSRKSSASLRGPSGNPRASAENNLSIENLENLENINQINILNNSEGQLIDNAKTEYAMRRSRKSSVSLRGSSGSRRVPSENNSLVENSEVLENVNQRSILNTSEVQLVDDAKTEYGKRRSRKSSASLRGLSGSQRLSPESSSLEVYGVEYPEIDLPNRSLRRDSQKSALSASFSSVVNNVDASVSSEDHFNVQVTPDSSKKVSRRSLRASESFLDKSDLLSEEVLVTPPSNRCPSSSSENILASDVKIPTSILKSGTKALRSGRKSVVRFMKFPLVEGDVPVFYESEVARTPEGVENLDNNKLAESSFTDFEKHSPDKIVPISLSQSISPRSGSMVDSHVKKRKLSFKTNEIVLSRKQLRSNSDTTIQSDISVCSSKSFNNPRYLRNKRSSSSAFSEKLGTSISTSDFDENSNTASFIGNETSFDFESVKTPRLSNDVLVSPLSSSTLSSGLRSSTKNKSTRKIPSVCLIDIGHEISSNNNSTHIEIEQSSTQYQLIYDIDSNIIAGNVAALKSPLISLPGVQKLESIQKVKKNTRSSLQEVGEHAASSTMQEELLVTPKQEKRLLRSSSDIEGMQTSTCVTSSVDYSDVGTAEQLLSSAKLQKSPPNNLSYVKGVRKLMGSPTVQTSPLNDLSDVKGHRRLITPRTPKSPVNDLSDLRGVERILGTPKVQKSPLNDLSDVRGLRRLMTTPRTPKSPANDLSDLKGVRRLLGSPKEQKSPRNDLSDVRGLRKLMTTPKTQKSPANDLSDLRGVKRLLGTPKVQKSPLNDLTDVKGLRKLLKTPRTQMSPSNDLSDLRGVRRLLGTPKVQKSPLNDLSDVRGLRRLMKTPRTPKSPANDLSDVRGVKKLFEIPKVYKSPLNDLTDGDCIDKLFSSPKTLASQSNDLSHGKELRRLTATPKTPKPSADLLGVVKVEKLAKSPKLQMSPQIDSLDKGSRKFSRSPKKENLSLIDDLLLQNNSDEADSIGMSKKSLKTNHSPASDKFRLRTLQISDVTNCLPDLSTKVNFASANMLKSEVDVIFSTPSPARLTRSKKIIDLCDSNTSSPVPAKTTRGRNKIKQDVAMSSNHSVVAGQELELNPGSETTVPLKRNNRKRRMLEETAEIEDVKISQNEKIHNSPGVGNDNSVTHKKSKRNKASCIEDKVEVLPTRSRRGKALQEIRDPTYTTRHTESGVLEVGDSSTSAHLNMSTPDKQTLVVQKIRGATETPDSSPAVMSKPQRTTRQRNKKLDVISCTSENESSPVSDVGTRRQTRRNKNVEHMEPVTEEDASNQDDTKASAEVRRRRRNKTDVETLVAEQQHAPVAEVETGAAKTRRNKKAESVEKCLPHEKNTPDKENVKLRKSRQNKKMESVESLPSDDVDQENSKTGETKVLTVTRSRRELAVEKPTVSKQPARKTRQNKENVDSLLTGMPEDLVSDAKPDSRSRRRKQADKVVAKPLSSENNVCQEVEKSSPGKHVTFCEETEELKKGKVATRAKTKETAVVEEKPSSKRAVKEPSKEVTTNPSPRKTRSKRAR